MPFSILHAWSFTIDIILYTHFANHLVFEKVILTLELKGVAIFLMVFEKLIVTLELKGVAIFLINYIRPG